MSSPGALLNTERQERDLVWMPHFWTGHLKERGRATILLDQIKLSAIKGLQVQVEDHA